MNFGDSRALEHRGVDTVQVLDPQKQEVVVVGCAWHFELESAEVPIQVVALEVLVKVGLAIDWRAELTGPVGATGDLVGTQKVLLLPIFEFI